MKEFILYHGSVSIIEQPTFGKGKRHNDYGLGFYCTQSLDLAKEWAVTENQDGYANKYTLPLEGLTILDLSKKEFTTLHWITLLLQNRVFTLKNDITKEGKKCLIEHFSLPIEDYDIIKGYRADDSYFAFAEAFLNNTISIQRLSKALKLGNLGEQIVLKSPKAFHQLHYLGYEKAEAKIYYPLRKERNEQARLKFLSNKKGSFTIDDLYLSDLIRGGIQ